MNATAVAKKAPGFIKNPDKFLEVEPTPRRVRVKFAGETIADSTHALLMCEGGHLPVYYFPMADVRMDLFTPTDHATHCGYKGDASYWTLTVGDRTEESVMWSYRSPYQEMLGITDYCAFYWDRMDSWWEEDEEIFRHPRDPKHRVDAILSHRPVKVVVGGETIAETTDARFVFETNHPVRYYIPKDDVRQDLLRPSDKRTGCPYKGWAGYHHLEVGGKTIEDAVWFYPEAHDEVRRIAGYLCFYPEKVDRITVGGKQV
jgi:uncharacterized protein (DUF427 family)